MTTWTAQQTATKFQTDAKTLRRFLRADAREHGHETPGKGSQWKIEGKTLQSLRSRFNKWETEQEQARHDRAVKAAKDRAQEVVNEAHELALEELEAEAEDHFGDEPFDEADYSEAEETTEDAS